MTDLSTTLASTLCRRRQPHALAGSAKPCKECLAWALWLRQDVDSYAAGLVATNVDRARLVVQANERAEASRREREELYVREVAIMKLINSRRRMRVGFRELLGRFKPYINVDELEEIIRGQAQPSGVRSEDQPADAHGPSGLRDKAGWHS